MQMIQNFRIDRFGDEFIKVTFLLSLEKSFLLSCMKNEKFISKRCKDTSGRAKDRICFGKFSWLLICSPWEIVLKMALNAYKNNVV